MILLLSLLLAVLYVVWSTGNLGTVIDWTKSKWKALRTWLK